MLISSVALQLPSSRCIFAVMRRGRNDVHYNGLLTIKGRVVSPAGQLHTFGISISEDDSDTLTVIGVLEKLFQDVSFFSVYCINKGLRCGYGW
ncbi:hypothetical protein COCNU_09G008270 [Cocos nucifera]|uniref:Uncharacterized protein n=1 Tax=Cocos nucifera TaxID=13894 RepID=A0A8K0IL39_COCNU|nr:hypothetical protein COCNU_09G008270 [Cocos nucifera]